MRILDAHDIPSALELSSAAGWNQTPADWAVLLELAPDSCFGIEVEGVLAATTTLLCYGQELAWLGMVLTRQHYRRRGLARMLLEHALSVADERGIATVRLDATEQGIRLYERLGFRTEELIERWIGRGLESAENEKSADALPLQKMEELDRRALGIGRPKLLKILSAHAVAACSEGAFAMHRPGRFSRYLGPCAALTEESARQVIEQCLRLDGGYWAWDIVRTNGRALRMAADFGFKADRQLTRMSRGASLVADSTMLFAIAGFELG